MTSWTKPWSLQCSSLRRFTQLIIQSLISMNLKIGSKWYGWQTVFHFCARTWNLFFKVGDAVYMLICLCTPQYIRCIHSWDFGYLWLPLDSVILNVASAGLQVKPLFAAAADGHMETVQKLLEAMADPNFRIPTEVCAHSLHSCEQIPTEQGSISSLHKFEATSRTLTCLTT